MNLIKSFLLLVLTFAVVVDAAKRNYYDVLGVPHNAEQAEIRRAYRYVSVVTLTRNCELLMLGSYEWML